MSKNIKARKIKPLSFIANLIFNIITLFLVMMCFVLIATNYSHKIPKMFDFMLINVTSGSMSPKYEKGDIVVIKKIDPDELKVGDVIAFYRYEEVEYSSIIWFHRIMEIHQDENGELLFLTQGDANRFPDANLSKSSSVIGVNGMSCQLINQIVGVLTSLKGIILFVILPASYIFIYETVILFKLIIEN